MELVETTVFSRQCDAQLSPDEYRLLQRHLVARAEAGAVMAGSGGLRKLRWRLPGRGKRGGARIIYSWKRGAGRLYLLFLYPKNVQADLTPAQLRVLRDLMAKEK